MTPCQTVPPPAAGSEAARGALGGASRPLPGAPACLALLAALVGAVYWRMFVDLFRVWSVDPNYSHGFVVFGCGLLFAVLAAGGDRERGGRFRLPAAIPAREALAGLLWIVVGFALGAAGGFVGNLLLGVVSLVFVLRGSLRVLGGEEAIKRFGFAVLFLIFMAPLPMAWYQSIAIALQSIASTLSAKILEAFGAAVFQEGYRIHLPGYTMEVGEACSGLRALTAVLALAVAVGHFAGRTSWYVWVLALAAAPIAVAANCLRVILTAVIMMVFGREWAEGVYHAAEGLAVVALAAVLLLAAAAGLSRLEGRWQSRKGASATGAS